MIEPLTSVLCTSTPPVLYVNLPLSQDYQFVLQNVLLCIISFLFNVWRVCILRPIYVDWSWLCFTVLVYWSTKEKEWQWLARWINILHRICGIPCPSQATCVQLSWVSRYSCICVGMFRTRCFLFSQCFLTKSYSTAHFADWAMPSWYVINAV